MKNVKYIFLTMLLYVASCKQDSKLNDNGTLKKEVAQDLFFPNYEQGDIKPDTLYIEVKIDDCGEFGGPPENFKLYVDSLKQYTLEYKRYRFNCDSIESSYNNVRAIEFKNTITLNDTRKKIFSDFIGKLTEGKISEVVRSNAGSRYYLHTSDSTFNIRIRSEDEKLKKNFSLFKKNIKLSK